MTPDTKIGDKITTREVLNEKTTSVILDQIYKRDSLFGSCSSYSISLASRSLGIGETALKCWVQQLQLERRSITPIKKAFTADQQHIQGLEVRVMRLEQQKSILQGALGVKQPTDLLIPDEMNHTYYEQVGAQETIAMICDAFEVSRSQGKDMNKLELLLQLALFELLFTTLLSKRGSHEIIFLTYGNEYSGAYRLLVMIVIGSAGVSCFFSNTISQTTD